jgi:hypothetical protein
MRRRRNYNINNAFCVKCGDFTYKGDGYRLVHEGFWGTQCAPCATGRPKQLEIFTEEVTVMKTEQVFKPMTEKQIKFIRDLFKANKESMTIDEQESLINKMKGHLDGSAVLSIQWGSKAIDKLKSYNTERSAS